MASLNRIERAELAGMPDQLKGTADFLEEPILAIELDAILDHFLKRLDPKSIKFLVLQTVQQSARRRILQAWMTHRRNFGAAFAGALAAGPPLTDPREVQKHAQAILEDFQRANQRAREDAIVLRIARLGEAQGLQTLAKSLFFLQAILCAQESIKQNVRWLEINQANPRGMRPYEFSPEGALEDYRRIDRFIAVTQFALARVFLSLYEIAAGGRPDSAEAKGWLGYASGGKARLILHDLEAVRAGRSPFAVWLGGALRTSFPQTASNAYILSLARTLELEHGAVDGRPLSRELTSELLWDRLKNFPPRFPDGTTVERRRGATEETTLQLLAGLQADPRSDSLEAAHAIDMASVLVGDPRVDTQSLLDWVQSLYGERRSFSEEQFVRFLQEANAFLPVMMRLNRDRKMIISREHRKDVDEELTASFDLRVIDTKENTVVEVIEIKQTSRPRLASDLGGILRQATDKLNGEIAPRTEPNLPPPQFRLVPGAPASRLRYLDARRSLIVQFPWELTPLHYKRGGLTLVAHANGRIERWQPRDGQEKGVLLDEQNLFIAIARHLPKITGVDSFDQIVLSDIFGRFLVAYFHERVKNAQTCSELIVAGPWRIQSFVGPL